MTDEPIETTEQEAPEKTGEKKPKRDPWLLWTRDIVICLLLVLLFRANVAEANYIPSPSMEPTLKVSDRIIVDKISLRWHPLERGELVVFHPPLEGREAERWIKRVIGLPGETVEVIRGTIYIDGQRLDEPYVENAGSYTKPPVVLSEDDPSTPENEAEYYLLGDNRANSRDSHVWGSCNADNIIGRAIFRYWPLGSMGSLQGEKDQVEVVE
jgi:signal peptidase I